MRTAELSTACRECSYQALCVFWLQAHTNTVTDYLELAPTNTDTNYLILTYTDTSTDANDLVLAQRD